MEQSKFRRRRGVILTFIGIKRLQEAIVAVEMTENQGERLSLEQLSNRINLSTKTVSKLWSSSAGVDQKTLKLCFSAFNLELQKEDYTEVNEASENQTLKLLSENSFIEEPSQFFWVKSFTQKYHTQAEEMENFLPYPDGPLPLCSPFYIERPPLEKRVYREVTQPGCVIRIRAPKQMGKSSLVLRLLAFAQSQGYHTVNLNCYQFDTECLTDLNKLLRRLCWRVATELGIPPNIKEQWNEEIGYNLSSSLYLEKYLLNQCQKPVVLVLNEIDHFFESPHICQDFFALLRSWCEEARHNPNWQKLRLVMVYSMEEYISLDINLSPFNIGLPISLSEFTQTQVEDLARRYGFNLCKPKDIEQLIYLLGGHPAMIQMSLYYLCCQEITMPELIQDAIANGGIYRYHLWRYSMKLHENPSLAKAYARILARQQDVSLNPIQAYKLESLGLIRFEGDRILPRCELYRAYFQKQLSTIEEGRILKAETQSFS
ncbi:AAA-like domain-containing protein [Scytonema hofmannii]